MFNVLSKETVISILAASKATGLADAQRIISSIEMPEGNFAPYTIWRMLAKEPQNGTEEVVGLKAYIPFHDALKYRGYKGNINAMPNKLVWFAFSFNKNKAAEKYQQCVMDLDESFRPEPRHINLMIDVLSQPNTPGYGRGYYGWGEAGTGKTSTAHWLTAILGQAIIQLNCKPNMEVEEMFVSHSAHDGKWSTVNGPILQALDNDWPLVIDEMDLAPSEFIPALNNMIEGRQFSVTFLDHMIKAKNGFKIFGFGNTGGAGLEVGMYNGRSQLDASSLDRMYKDYYTPLDQEKAELIVSSRGYELDDLAKKICTFVVKINQSVREEHSLSEMISPRGLTAIMQSITLNTGIVRNPVLYAIGTVMGTILEDKESLEKVFAIYALTVAESAKDVKEITDEWEHRYEILESEANSTDEQKGA